jgi:Vasohibin
MTDGVSVMSCDEVCNPHVTALLLDLQRKAIATLSTTQLAAAQLSSPPMPKFPNDLHLMGSEARLKRLQEYIESYRYNFAPGYLHNVRKRRPFSEIVNTARDIMSSALPIKCIEGVFLALYLTCQYSEWDRYPLGFKSTMQGHKAAFRCAAIA